MKNIVILGAAGRTGQLLVDDALRAGYKVTGFVRTGEKIAPKQNLTVIEGDARKAEDLQFAFGNQDAIISTLGSSKLNDDLITQSTKVLVEAAKSNNVKRVIMMSSFLASGQLKMNIISKILSRLSQSMVGDKQAGEDILKQSNLDYTIVYSTRLTDDNDVAKVTLVRPNEFVTPKNSTSRASVAAFLVSEIENTEHIKQSILITAR
jgi:putative NADH-flavin reductase